MSKNWQHKQFRDIIDIKHGYPFKGEFFSASGKYVLLTPGNFFEAGGFKRVTAKDKYYIGEFPEEYLHKKDDLIVAMTEQAEGLLGSCALVPEDNLYLHNQRLGHITMNENEVDKKFIYYLFQMKYIRKQIRLTSTGSKVKHTSPERIYDVELFLPPFAEQQKIASILSTLDKKIALNNQINQELEAMAKTLYDYWFVQFDFQNDKGKPYKSSGGKMVYSEELRREIPEGWEDGFISDIVDNIKEKNNDKERNTLPYVPIDDLPRKKLISGTISPNTEAKSSLIYFKKNDILMGAMRVYFHRVCLSIQDGITRTTTFVLRSREKYLRYYALMTINTNESISFATKNSKGSTIPYTFWTDGYEKFAIVLPPKKLLEKFNEILIPIFEKASKNEKENQKLTQLRDWLLPMLLNGQVSVADAKEQVDELMVAEPVQRYGES